MIIIKWFEYNIRNLDDSEYNKWYQLLSQQRKEHIDSFKSEYDKKRSIAGEMLVKKAISERCKIDIKDITIETAQNGKPYAKGLNIEFNISHSNDMVVCVVGSNSVGIDIEKIRPLNLKTAKRVFNNEELFKLFGYTPNDDDFNYTSDIEILTRFFKLWTAKESYLKCKGTGILKAKKTVCKNTETFLLENGYVLSITSISSKK